ncbi:MAG: class I tRNA ligase family protein, partial [Candidatus Latescibacteria bacterium]|nr:class I tRNA ligase family protein [Candidatus Latescibacterota bacterium]
MDIYDFQKIEKHWQEVWEREDTLNVEEDSKKPRAYVLDMFPGPSGPLHMGHVKNYGIGDVVARYRIRQGDNVFRPIGWDAFGLPAEIAAIKHGVHPQEWTDKQIAIQSQQFKSLGIHNDWSSEINTSDPEYYRWNQWLFLKLYEHGLAYQTERSVNWCPQCQTTLANEEVIAGACERCDTEIIEKPLQQWFLKITAYADALLKGLDDLPNWPDRVKTMQRHWIGRSEGAEVFFTIPDQETQLTVFTTRPDTLFGVTFIALSSDHPIAKQVGCYLRENETGMDTGIRAIHPITKENIPIWVADYVLMDYGTGAVMGVP